MHRLALSALIASVTILADAGSAWAESGPRLVPGGPGMATLDPGPHGATEVSAELFAKNGFKLGALVDVEPRGGQSRDMGLGGFASFTLESFTLGSALRSTDDLASADITASYAATFGTAAITLGYGWSGGQSVQAFTPSGYAGHHTSGVAGSPTSDMSIAVNFTHDLVSAVHVGGFAAANRGQYEDRSTEHGFRVGAILGWKF